MRDLFCEGDAFFEFKFDDWWGHDLEDASLERHDYEKNVQHVNTVAGTASGVVLCATLLLFLLEFAEVCPCDLVVGLRDTSNLLLLGGQDAWHGILLLCNIPLGRGDKSHTGCGRGLPLVHRGHSVDTTLLLFLPAYACWAFLLARRRVALRLGWAACRVWPLATTLGRLAATWLACLAVNPAFAIVAAEPLLEAIASCFCHCYPSSLRRPCGISPRHQTHMR